MPPRPPPPRPSPSSSSKNRPHNVLHKHRPPPPPPLPIPLPFEPGHPDGNFVVNDEYFGPRHGDGYGDVDMPGTYPKSDVTMHTNKDKGGTYDRARRGSHGLLPEVTWGHKHSHHHPDQTHQNYKEPFLYPTYPDAHDAHDPLPTPTLAPLPTPSFFPADDDTYPHPHSSSSSPPAPVPPPRPQRKSPTRKMFEKKSWGWSRPRRRAEGEDYEDHGYGLGYGDGGYGSGGAGNGDGDGMVDEHGNSLITPFPLDVDPEKSNLPVITGEDRNVSSSSTQERDRHRAGDGVTAFPSSTKSEDLYTFPSSGATSGDKNSEGEGIFGNESGAEAGKTPMKRKSSFKRRPRLVKKVTRFETPTRESFFPLSRHPDRGGGDGGGGGDGDERSSSNLYGDASVEAVRAGSDTASVAKSEDTVYPHKRSKSSKFLDQRRLQSLNTSSSPPIDTITIPPLTPDFPGSSSTHSISTSDEADGTSAFEYVPMKPYESVWKQPEPPKDESGGFEYVPLKPYVSVWNREYDQVVEPAEERGWGGGRGQGGGPGQVQGYGQDGMGMDMAGGYPPPPQGVEHVVDTQMTIKKKKSWLPCRRERGYADPYGLPPGVVVETQTQDFYQPESHQPIYQQMPYGQAPVPVPAPAPNPAVYPPVQGQYSPYPIPGYTGYVYPNSEYPHTQHTYDVSAAPVPMAPVGDYSRTYGGAMGDVGYQGVQFRQF